IIRTIDSVGDVGVYSSIARGADGFPVISYYDQTNDALKFAKCNDASCAKTTILTLDAPAGVAVGRYSSIGIGSDGYPAISYYDNTTTGLKFLHCNGYCGAMVHVNHSQNVIPGSTLQNGLVGMWSFNGPDVSWTQNKAFDRSGQGNDGTMTNMATTTSPTIGKVGQALKFRRFNGVDIPWVEVTDASSLNLTTNFTVGAWIKRSETGTANEHWVYDSGTQAGHWRLGLNTSNVPEFSEYAVADYYATTPISDTNWHHIVAVKNGDSGANVSIYRDGVLDGTVTVGTVSTPSGNKVIGDETAHTNAFEGAIDEVRVYNRALSQSEITKLYQSGVATINASQNNKIVNGLVGMWSFNGPDVTDKVYDRSGQGNNGYFIGGATSSAKTIGKIGQALKFVKSTSQHVDAGIPGSLTDLAQKSVCAWIKPSSFGTGLTGGGDIVSKHETATSHGWFLTLTDFDGGVQTLYFLQTFSVSGYAIWRAPAAAITLNQWQHVCVTYDDSSTSNNPSLYVNGVSQTVSIVGPPSGSVFSDSAANLFIGNFSDLTAPFDGPIDEVRIYNRILSATEIRNLYLQGK
ncbi:MAG: LamG domain-containing protein, partial [Acidobacteriota bacterium]